MKAKGWREVSRGGVIPGGSTSEAYKTGAWRSHRPLLDREKCNDCLLCWIFCPDSSIHTKDGKLTGFDWEHCKGCGICAQVCPITAISMVEEALEQ